MTTPIGNLHPAARPRQLPRKSMPEERVATSNSVGAAGEHKKRFLATINENGLDRLEIRRDN